MTTRNDVVMRDDLTIEFHEWDERACEGCADMPSPGVAAWIVYMHVDTSCGCPIERFFCTRCKDILLTWIGLEMKCRVHGLRGLFHIDHVEAIR